MPHITRREWHRLALGGGLAAATAGWLPAGARRAFAAQSTFAGVRIGLQSYSFRDMSLDEGIAAMNDLGITSCELWEVHVEPRELRQPENRERLRRWRTTISLDYFEEIGARFTEAGIELNSYNLSFKDHFSDAEIDRGFEMARALGAPAITASANMNTVPRIAGYAERHGMPVAMHNHSRVDPNEFSSPDDFARAIEMGGAAPIAVNLDIGHFVAANHDPIAFLREHHQRIVTLHLKDRKRNQGSNTPWGEGDTPIRETLHLLRDEGWAIPANIEYEYDGGDTLTELRRCLDYCREALDDGNAWLPLFDGRSLEAWRGYKQETMPDGWQVVNGTLARVGQAGDIITREQFENFELRFDWQVETGGNSGIFFGVTEEVDGPVWHSGPEYQVLHNAGHQDGADPITSAGSNYAVHPPSADVTRPAGEWNRARLVVNRGRVEHWMNGAQLLAYELGSADWQSRVAASKHADLPSYGRIQRGHIAIQDHGDPVRFRNIFIRPIN